MPICTILCILRFCEEKNTNYFNVHFCKQITIVVKALGLVAFVYYTPVIGGVDDDVMVLFNFGSICSGGCILYNVLCIIYVLCTMYYLLCTIQCIVLVVVE